MTKSKLPTKLPATKLKPTAPKPSASVKPTTNAQKEFVERISENIIEVEIRPLYFLTPGSIAISPYGRKIRLMLAKIPLTENGFEARRGTAVSNHDTTQVVRFPHGSLILGLEAEHAVPKLVYLYSEGHDTEEETNSFRLTKIRRPPRFTTLVDVPLGLNYLGQCHSVTASGVFYVFIGCKI